MPAPITTLLKHWVQYLAPQTLLTNLMYALTRLRLSWWKNWQIRWFIRRYHVDMSIAAQPDPLRYPDFNTFFTRALRPESRPICSGAQDIACPVDGRISALGQVHEGRLLQAKGHDYALSALLGGAPERAQAFAGGNFMTLYLSPKDYHRIHMPARGRLREMLYVPGRLFSVNETAVARVPGLFARNERLVCFFDTEAGPMAMVLVGALFVSGLETVWSGPITPPHGQAPQVWHYTDHNAPVLERGQEMGRFNMGSTVILVYGPGVMTWQPDLRPAQPVVMGQCLGTFLPSQSA